MLKVTLKSRIPQVTAAIHAGLVTAVNSAAQSWAEVARQLAPVNKDWSVPTVGYLRASISAGRPGDSGTASSLTTKFQGPSAANFPSIAGSGKSTISASVKADAYYAGFVEFGFTHYLSGEFIGPQPFFVPAMQSAKRQLIDTLPRIFADAGGRNAT